MTPLLDARAVAVRNRLAPADLRLDGPELVCLVGPNGSGKTSLLHGLAGIGDSVGSVQIDGVDPTDVAPDSRKRLLCYLPASRDIAWPVSAVDLIRLGLPVGSEPDEIIAELELGQVARRRVDRLSTGERSRVLIARALAPRPRLLLLDEPAANLDPLWQLRLMELLVRSVRERGQAALVAMHDLDLAARYADRLILMDSGKVIEQGAPQAILAGEALQSVFGISRVAGEWRAINPTAGRRSSL
jgi:iron complex transport system ATP-binding protein